MNAKEDYNILAGLAFLADKLGVFADAPPTRRKRQAGSLTASCRYGVYTAKYPIVKILAVSDQVVDRIYGLITSGHFHDIKLLLGCGDLPYPYLENLVTMMNLPLFYVPGNHDPAYSDRWPQSCVEGATNVDLKLVRHKELLIGGLGGSIQYRPDGVNQYTQREAYFRVISLLPGLWWNRIRYGRALDILISHSPAFGIHDDDTQAHRGLQALNWLLRMARPRYHFHGHTHFYRQNLADSVTRFGPTQIMNVYPYKVIEIPNDV